MGGVIQAVGVSGQVERMSLRTMIGRDLQGTVHFRAEVGRELAADASFGPMVLEPPQVLGAESLGESQVTLRLLLKTLPSKQWDMARELRRRIKNRFDREKIAVLYPHRVVVTRAE